RACRAPDARAARETLVRRVLEGSHDAAPGPRPTHRGPACRPASPDLRERHVRVAPQLLDRVELVRPLVDDAFDARVHEHLEAMDARRVGEIDVGVTDGV